MIRENRRLISSSPVAKSTFSLFFLAITLAPQASAYLDPGTGGFLLQILLASVLAVVMYARNSWLRLKQIVRWPGVSGDSEACEHEKARVEEVNEES